MSFLKMSQVMNFNRIFTMWMILLGCIVVSLGQTADQSCDCGPNGTDCAYIAGNKICICEDGYKQNEGICREKCSCRRHYSACFIVNGEINCSCDAGYVQKQDMCVDACSEKKPCENGGQCVKGICNCSNDLGGNFCQIIKQCEYEDLCGEDPNTKCLYDVLNEEAFCSCKKRNQIFVKDEKKCRVPCNNTSNCLHGGECLEKEEGHFCQCKPTLLGDFCEIPTCDKPCFYGSSCKFVPELGRSECVCHQSEQLPDLSEKLCRNPCYSDSDCKNGAKCKGDKNAKFCDCQKGTSGSFCEKLDYCYQCGHEEGVKCVYNITERVTQCLCDDKEKKFDADTRKCRAPCESDSFCIYGSCSANRERYPDVEYEKREFCNCLEGTSGDRCQIVDECVNGETDCGEGDDVECKYDNNLYITTCKCMGNLRNFDESDKTCKDCSCGSRTISCYIHEGKKLCHCYTGYVQLNDTCEKCNCGEGSLGCEIDYVTGEKICKCKGGYQQNGTICQRCDCGQGSTFCSFDKISGEKTCICRPLYKQNGATCESCDCGRHMEGCDFNDGEKVCDCRENYTQHNGICIRE